MALDVGGKKTALEGPDKNAAAVASALRVGTGEPNKLVVHTARIGITAAFLGLWQLASHFRWVDPFFISSPSRVGVRLWDWLFASGPVSAIGNVSLATDVEVTMRETLIGFGIGCAAGILIGFILAEVAFLDQVFSPLLNLLNTLPRVALAPLFIVWFGIGEETKVVLVISVVVFIMMFNTYAGAKTVDRDIATVAKLLGANRRQMMRAVIFPWCLPWIFAGVRLSLAWALGAAVIGEYLAADAGVGYRIFYYAGILDNTGVIAGCIVLLALALALFTVLALIERKVLRWQSVK
jgi:NitT/TauT family transport system permease protein